MKQAGMGELGALEFDFVFYIGLVQCLPFAVR